MVKESADNSLIFITNEAGYTQASIAAMSDRLSYHLLARGACAGEHIVVLSESQMNIFVSTSACFQAGFILVCLDPSMGTEQVAAVLNEVNPTAVLADRPILESLVDVQTVLPGIVLDTSTTTSVRSWLPVGNSAKWTTSHSVLNASTSGFRAKTESHILATNFSRFPDVPQIDDRQAAYIMFTSGSTNKPKGVVVSREALRQHVDTLCDVFNYSPDSKLLCHLPAHHTDGLVHCCYVPLLRGMCVVRPGAFNISAGLQLEGLTHRPTHFLAVPTIFSMLCEFYADQPGMFASCGVKTLISTAGTLDAVLWRQFENIFGVQLLNFYGLTETVSGALYCDSRNHFIGSVGKPVGVQARLVANDKEVLGCDATGELQLRGQQLMDGYFQNNKASADALQDGWFKTGDIFTRDENGFFFFKGRIKEMIKKGGITVYPQEVRQPLREFCGVVECEVVGVPDPVFEEIIVACLVTTKSLKQSALQSYCEDVLAKEMRPDHFVFFDRLPRTAVGKIKRPELLSAIQNQLKIQNTPAIKMVDQTLDEINTTIVDLAATTFKLNKDELHEKMGKDQISGWDSYAHLKFIKQIERIYSIRLKARDIMKIETLEDAIALVREKTKSTEAA